MATLTSYEFCLYSPIVGVKKNILKVIPSVKMCYCSSIELSLYYWIALLQTRSEIEWIERCQSKD